MRSLVFPFLKVGHDTVHDVWLRAQEVESLDIAVGGASISDLLDVWSKSGRCDEEGEGRAPYW